MFSLFTQLPAEIRRKIWLSTLGPMEVTFTSEQEPPKENDHSHIDLSMFSKEECDEVFPPSIFTNFCRYYGYVSLPDGSRRLTFVVRSSAAYRACQESREFLRFVFAEPPQPGGGLPGWLRFDIDTICCSDFDLSLVARHPWFIQTQHLYITMSFDIDDYLAIESQEEDEFGIAVRRPDWIKENLTSLKDVTYQLLHARCERWADIWRAIFEEWYNSKYGDEPVAFYAQVITYVEGRARAEWLTSTNYLRTYKLMMHKRLERRAAHFEDWREWMMGNKEMSIFDADDSELDNPAEFLKRHRPQWDWK